MFPLKLKFIISVFFVFASCLVFGQARMNTELPSSGKWAQFYPNPASNFINFDPIRVNESGHSLHIFNFMGRKIHEIKNFNSHTSIDLQRYFRGIYIYQIRNRKGYVLESGKFQIVK